MGGICSTQGEMTREYEISVGKPEGKRPVGRFRRKWEDNVFCISGG
jgi:hypothetical protein